MIDNNNNHKFKDVELNKVKQFQTFIDDNVEHDFDKDMDIDELANTINDDKLIEEDIKTFIELQKLVKEIKIKVDKDIDIDELANKLNGDDLL
jgi:hypothetical protein